MGALLVFRVQAALLFLLISLSRDILVTSDAPPDVRGSCCNIGIGLASNATIEASCDSFAVPIANVSAVDQDLCVATIELCCLAQKSWGFCQKGIEAAERGRGCEVPKATCFEEATPYRECCLGCKLGKAATSTRTACTYEFPANPNVKAAFEKCCTPLKSTDNAPGKHSNAIEGPPPQQQQQQRDQRCPQGFIFNEMYNVCDDLDECLEDVHTCDLRFETCVNTVGDYLCEPKDPGDGEDGSGGLGGCDPGFKFYLISCIDIDECSENKHNCSSNEVCVNVDGSFRCEHWEAAAGSNAELSCPQGYEVNDEGSCEDIDECATGNHDCNEEAQQCQNTLGSFQCIRFMHCGTGYVFNQRRGRCEDVDECSSGLDNCGALGAAFTCRNTQGSFRCDRRSCSRGLVLDEASGQCQPLICEDGFVPGPNSEGCVDVDECERNPCDAERQRCRNTYGSFECITVCAQGQVLNGQGQCEDRDECLEISCPGGKLCTNIVGGYRCDCPAGFRVDPVTDTCQDIDECKNPYTVCGTDSECINRPGSYRCVCKSGFQRSGETTDHPHGRCVDTNECRTIPGICQQRCTNLWGSFRCHCRPGYRLASDGRRCMDIDECQEYEGLCIGNCLNEPGTYRCTCPQGYKLSKNKRSCEDIDECNAATAAGVGGSGSPCRTGSDQQCFNTRGGFKCVDIACPANYTSDNGTTTSRRCKLKPVARNCASTSDLECLRRPVSLSYNFISLVSNLRVMNSNSDIGIDLFTMQSARYFSLTTRFTLDVVDVRAAKDVPSEADRSFFRLKNPVPHRAVVSLVKPLHGPQDVTLELRMDMYHLGKYQASALAKLYIFVTPYTF